eukprot:10555829-Karenia_brevis.AAC.1
MSLGDPHVIEYKQPMDEARTVRKQWLRDMGPYRYAAKAVQHFNERRRDGHAMDSQSVWYE